jgi:hypothetical protein
MEGYKFTPTSFRDWSLARFHTAAKIKYDKGQDEHGGKVFERVSIDEIEDEVIDMWHFVQALRVKLNILEREGDDDTGTTSEYGNATGGG